jgi:hypothetical protein
MGNGTIRIVQINRKLGIEATTPDESICYNYMEGLTHEEEVILLEAEEFLHPIGTLATADIFQVSSTNPSFPSLPLISPIEGSMPIDEVPIWKKVKTICIAKWSQTEEDQLRDLNLGTTTDPSIIRIGTIILENLLPQRKELFHSFKDVFAWLYHDLRDIPQHVSQHKIELDTSVPPTHQVRYWMNPDYAQAVKNDLNKLLQAGFIKPIDHATSNQS